MLNAIQTATEFQTLMMFVMTLPLVSQFLRTDVLTKPLLTPISMVTVIQEFTLSTLIQKLDCGTMSKETPIQPTVRNGLTKMAMVTATTVLEQMETIVQQNLALPTKIILVAQMMEMAGGMNLSQRILETIQHSGKIQILMASEIIGATPLGIQPENHRGQECSLRVLKTLTYVPKPCLP